MKYLTQDTKEQKETKAVQKRTRSSQFGKIEKKNQKEKNSMNLRKKSVYLYLKIIIK